MKPSAFMMLLTAAGDFAYRREDGITVMATGSSDNRQSLKYGKSVLKGLTFVISFMLDCEITGMTIK